MKERGILYTPDNIRAIREGRKTQTRRIMKVQPPSHDYQIATCVSTTGPRHHEGRQHWVKVDGYTVLDSSQSYFSCPYGVAGDRLYVKECHSIFEGPGSFSPFKTGRVAYRADYPDGKNPSGLPWKSSLFMPKWAARLWLEITEVRVERLQDISEADAIAEGVKPCGHTSFHVDEHTCSYRDLWDSINEKDGHGWETNPFVWVLTFKVIEP